MGDRDRFDPPQFNADEEEEDAGSLDITGLPDGAATYREFEDLYQVPEIGSSDAGSLDLTGFSSPQGSSSPIPNVASFPDAEPLSYIVSDKKLPPMPDGFGAEIAEWAFGQIRRVQQSKDIQSIINTVASSPQDILQLPEFMSLLTDSYEAMSEDPDMGPYATAMQYGTMENAMAALYAESEAQGFHPIANSALEQPNVSTFMDEFGNSFRPDLKQMVLTIGGSVDTNDPYAPATPSSPAGLFFNPISSLTNIGRDPRNYREELFFDATEYLRGKPMVTVADERDFTVWMWRRGQQLNDERLGRQSHLGSVGVALDLPVTLTSYTANSILNQLVFPDDPLNRGHGSLGKNLAYSFDMHMTDMPGSSILNSTFGKPFAGVLKYGVNIAVPAAAAVSAYRLISPAEDGGLVQTPWLGDVVNSMQESNSFELTSGTADVLKYLALDPVNYAAAAGIGYKFTSTLARPSNISRGRLIFDLLKPVWGARGLGPRGGLTTRLTWAMNAKTVDEWVDVARASRSGREMFSVMQGADSLEEAMARIPALKNNAATPILLDAAKRGDEDFFWETSRALLHGANRPGNPTSYAALDGLISRAGDNLHEATNRALARGQAGIGDVILPELGSDIFGVVYEVADVATSAPVRQAIPELVVRGDAVNPGVVESVTSNAKKLSASDIVLEYSDALITVRKSGQNYAAFDTDTGKVLGGLEIPNKQIGVVADSQRKGIADRLADAAEADGLNPIEALSSGPITQDFVNWATRRNQRAGANFTPGERFVVRPSELAGDATTKYAVNSNLGWKELDGTSPELIAWVHKSGNTKLSYKLSLIRDGRRSLMLTDDEWLILQQFVDNVADADALRLGDELLVGSSSQRKLLMGQDLEEATDIAALIPDDYARSVDAHTVGQVIDGRHRQITLINELPSVSRRTQWGVNSVKWLGLNGRARGKATARRIFAGLKELPPQTIKFTNASEGGNDMRRMMKLLGITPETRNAIMEDWWRAKSVEGRRDVYRDAFVRMGEDLNNQPHLKYQFIEFPTRHGVQGYAARMSDGAEIGAGRSIDGADVIRPVMKAHMEKEGAVPNISGILQTMRRYRHSKFIPSRITRGWGQTEKNRQGLVSAYKSKLGSTPSGRAALKEMGEDADDILMSVAYADVLGFDGRSSGMGKVNKVLSTLAKPYNFFHQTFTIAQLAFRPFAWSSRVLMEEHVRAWMMDIPSVIRHPVQYGEAFWNKHLLQTFPRDIIKQQEAAIVASHQIFKNADTVDEAVELADEILPGWSAKIKKTDGSFPSASRMRAQLSHDLSDALTGGTTVDLAGRGVLSRATLRRSERLPVRRQKLLDNYGIKADDWDFQENVPEMVNKSNVWLLADEMDSSIQDLKFVENMRPKDVRVFGHQLGKKVQQIANDQAGHFTVKRMIEQIQTPNSVTHNAESFVRTSYWLDVKDNIADIARKRNIDWTDDVDLANFYLDTIMRDEMINSAFGGFWLDNPDEKLRILTELKGRKAFTVAVGDEAFTLKLGSASYASNKSVWADMMLAQKQAGNYEFPRVMGIFHPLYANPDEMGWVARNNPFRKWTNWMLQTFGEDVSQQLHRRPAYLTERQRWLGTYRSLGWDEVDSARMAHQKAFEMVNYTFFNNQHTGMLLHKMNKIVPFFSAWAEVASTWAWKIPSQNYLPLGYARMLHRVDAMMMGLVKMGMVDIGEDGQWHLNLEDQPDQLSPLGRGLSKAGFEMMSTPINTIEHIGNMGRALRDSLDDEYDYKPVDFSAWAKDNYSIAIGSPVKVNSHGVMGVNQLQFGFNPVFSHVSSETLKRLPFAGDTEILEGATLEEVYEGLPSRISVAEFLEMNRDTLVERMGQEEFDAMFSGGREFIPPGNIDTTGLTFQVPGTSWLDGVLGDTFYPFGTIDTKWGIVRQLVPSSISYIMRGFGLMVDDLGLEGLNGIVMGPAEQSQVEGEMARAVLYLESTEGLVSQVTSLERKAEGIVSAAGFDTVEEFKQSVTIGSDGFQEYADLERRIIDLDEQIVKRSTDIAAFSITARGIMGLFSPATPRMQYEEQKVTAQWWASMEMAEAAKVRGSLSWAEAMKDVEVSSVDDLNRMMGFVGEWLGDDTGSDARRWLHENYPAMEAWIQPTSYWGPAGVPPSFKDINEYFDAIEAGHRTPFGEDVLQQKVARAAVDSSYESTLRQLSGTSDPTEQFLWELNNPDAARSLLGERRMKYKALDVWDDELNGGAYIEWRERNDTTTNLFERWEEQIYQLQDASDEIFALADLTGIFDAGEQRLFEGKLNAALSQYRAALFTVEEEIAGLDDSFQNPRERLRSQYYSEVVGPFYEGRIKIYERLQDAESALDRGEIFEEVRQYENDYYHRPQTMLIDGTNVTVPNEMERAWGLYTETEQHAQTLRWVGRKVEWLSDFSIDKVIEEFPLAEQYLPSSPEARAVFFEATESKKDILKEIRDGNVFVKKSERSRRLEQVDEWLVDELAKRGLTGEAQWIDAWPIERLVLSNSIPAELGEVASYYLGIKEVLQANDPPKGPTSNDGDFYFDSLIRFFEAPGGYFELNPLARDALDKLGKEMFEEEGRYSVYAHLYGDFNREVEL